MNNQNEIASSHPAGNTPGVKPVYPTQACQTYNCEIAIHIGVFFDGTAMGVGNNRDDNNKSRPANNTVARWIREWLNAFLMACLLLTAPGCQAREADLDKEGIGVGITGIDHLADHLSVQSFSVNGYNGGRAGGGGGTVCCATLPRKWQPGMTVKVQWEVTNWPARGFSDYEREVPIERYEEVGQLWVHFLADGTVRVVSSLDAPESPTYPGPHDPIPQKNPWDEYPGPSVSVKFRQVPDAMKETAP